MSFPYVGPIPPWTNPPLQPEFFRPGRFVISDITLGITTTITTTEDLTFSLGQLVRVLIPPQCGCRQLNNRVGFAISFPADNQVEVSIDSSKGVNAFAAAPDEIDVISEPQLLAVGDTNSGTINSTGRTNTGTYIPGSFINTSPIG